jgi:hypothetical protein
MLSDIEKISLISLSSISTFFVSSIRSEILHDFNHFIFKFLLTQNIDSSNICSTLTAINIATFLVDLSNFPIEFAGVEDNNVGVVQ